MLTLLILCAVLTTINSVDVSTLSALQTAYADQGITRITITQDITVNSPTTLNRNNGNVDVAGDNPSRKIYISSSGSLTIRSYLPITISNLVFDGQNEDRTSPCILASRGGFTFFQYVTMTGCRNVNGKGGALAVTVGTNVVIAFSQITNNYANKAGGAISFLSTGRLFMCFPTFQGNSADDENRESLDAYTEDPGNVFGCFFGYQTQPTIFYNGTNKQGTKLQDVGQPRNCPYSYCRNYADVSSPSPPPSKSPPPIPPPPKSPPPKSPPPKSPPPKSPPPKSPPPKSPPPKSPPPKSPPPKSPPPKKPPPKSPPPKSPPPKSPPPKKPPPKSPPPKKPPPKSPPPKKPPPKSPPPKSPPPKSPPPKKPPPKSPPPKRPPPKSPPPKRPPPKSPPPKKPPPKSPPPKRPPPRIPPSSN